MFREGNDYKIDLEKLQRDLDHEADCKYDFIIERTNEIVGKITDAGGLSIGRKGDLNGLIIGTNGTAKVQTIGAGGYNIQCYRSDNPGKGECAQVICLLIRPFPRMEEF